MPNLCSMNWVHDLLLLDPNAFARGARATELESSGALVEQPFKSVLLLPGSGQRQRGHCDVPII